MNRLNRNWSELLTARHAWILFILLPGIWALFARPLMPLEETRAAGVAWEMWLRGDLLVPHMNHEPYHHKPPLLFWLMHIGWAVFGVNDWWPRLVGPLATLAGTLLTRRLASELRPNDGPFRELATWLMAGSMGWILYGQMLMYDALLTACVLLALIGLWRAGAAGTSRAWWLVVAGIGLGILAKGPVALLHIGVPALLGPLWSEAARTRPLAWYGRLFAALLGGLLIAGSWAGLAAWMGGDEYARMIFLEQTSGRLVKSFAHERPWWVYLLFLPLLVLPWIILPSVWRGMLKERLSGSQRFLLSWVVGCVIVLSLVSGKQPHYVVPEIPALMLLVAGRLSLTWTPRRIARMAAAWTLTLLTLLSIVMWNMYAEFDMGPPGRLVHDLQEEGVPVATTGHYNNQLAFPGRLTQPLYTIDRSEIRTWLEDNPGGVIVTFREELPEHYGLEVFISFPYRRGFLRILGPPENRPVSIPVPPPEA